MASRPRSPLRPLFAVRAPRHSGPRRSIGAGLRCPTAPRRQLSHMADEATTYSPGTPIWVDLSTTDIDAGRTFYQDLFGWTSDEPAPPEFGGYALFRQGDKVVAG